MITTRIPLESVARVTFSVAEEVACAEQGTAAIAMQNKGKNRLIFKRVLHGLANEL
jgi:hypothetical protein